MSNLFYGFVGETCLFTRDIALKWFKLKKSLDVFGRLPACEDFKLAKCNSNLRLMVWIGELLRVLVVETSGEFFIGVDLEWKGFGDGQNLGTASS